MHHLTPEIFTLIAASFFLLGVYLERSTFSYTVIIVAVIAGVAWFISGLTRMWISYRSKLDSEH